MASVSAEFMAQAFQMHAEYMASLGLLVLTTIGAAVFVFLDSRRIPDGKCQFFFFVLAYLPPVLGAVAVVWRATISIQKLVRELQGAVGGSGTLLDFMVASADQFDRDMGILVITVLWFFVGWTWSYRATTRRETE